MTDKLPIEIRSTRPGKYTFYEIKVGGLDIANRVQSFTFQVGNDMATHLVLDLVIYGEDVVDLDIPHAELTVNAKVLRDGELIEASAQGDASHKYLVAASKQ